MRNARRSSGVRSCVQGEAKTAETSRGAVITGAPYRSTVGVGVVVAGAGSEALPQPPRTRSATPMKTLSAIGRKSITGGLVGTPVAVELGLDRTNQLVELSQARVQGFEQRPGTADGDGPERGGGIETDLVVRGRVNLAEGSCL